MSSEKLHNMPEEKAFEPAESFLPKTSENIIARINDNPRLHIFNKAVRNALIGAQVIGLTLTSAGCVNTVNTSTENSSLPTPVIEMVTSTPIENVPTETQPATETAVNPPGFIPASETQTPEVEQPSEVWQLSPDGHVYYNESELYGGLFTINKENPENVEKYWENTVRGLWNLNNIAKNTTFINQFPTDDSLIKYLNEGGGPISNLWIPTIYPDARRQFWYGATMTPVDGKVDLSKIAISIYKPTKDEIYSYSPSYASGTTYISYLGGGEQVKIEKDMVDDINILKFTFRSDILVDTTYSGEGALCLALDTNKTSQENLEAATQLIMSFPARIKITQEIANQTTGATWWMIEYSPPELNIDNIFLEPDVFNKLKNISNSPLGVR